MNAIFSDSNKYFLWRKLWIALAKAEKTIGLPITLSQIEALESHIHEIDFEKVEYYEKKMRHDVMAHLHAFGDLCPESKGILHMGATSTFVTDNADLIQMHTALKLLIAKSIELLRILTSWAEEYEGYPTLGYTHLQPAQLTTVGKRICLWLQDFLMDSKDLIQQNQEMQFLGLKGATGTQASFLQLCNHDSDQVEKLEQLIANEMGFEKVFIIAGQTYTRKQDMRILSCLEGLAATSHKCATDLRLLSHLGEMEESKPSTQIGSSAMPHKRNPIYCERICGLARFLISLCQNPTYTFATQWLERSLDDSANRRLAVPEAFLTADALLNLLIHLFSNLKIFPENIEENLEKHLSSIALENILMHVVKRGLDRQEIHEKLRKSPEKGKEIAREMGLSPEEIAGCFLPDIGRAAHQVEQFLNLEVSPFLSQFQNLKAPLSPVDI